MNEQELRQQIDMFFKGELSDTEEQGLRDYLATHEVPEDFIQEKRIILSLIPDRSVHIPDHLEEKLSSYIDRLPDKKRQVLFFPKLEMDKRYRCRYYISDFHRIIRVPTTIFQTTQRSRNICLCRGSTSFNSRFPEIK